MGPSKKKLVFFLLLLILIIAVFFRFWQLAEIPPGLYPDIAMNGTNALEALKTGHFQLFYQDNNGREGLFINLIALCFLILGPSVLAIKLVAAIFGTLTVLGLYLLTKELFRHLGIGENLNDPTFTEVPAGKQNSKIGNYELIALFSSFFLAISFWHVNFSRIGFRAISMPFFAVWSFYFLFKALSSQRLASYNMLLAGLFFGLGFHTYIAFRVAPLILVPILIIQIARYWPIFKNVDAKKFWRSWIIFFAALVLAAAPMAFYFFGHRADFFGRTNQVSIFSSASPIKTLAESTIKTLGQFVIRGDSNWRHNLSGSPQILWLLIPFFLIGFFYSLFQIFKKKNYHKENLSLLTCHWTLIVFWGAMLLPVILTNEGVPHALRSIGAIVPTFIFTGLGFWLFISKIDSWIRPHKQSFFAYNFIGIGLIILFLLAAGVLEYNRYFIAWAQNPEVRGAFTQKFVDEANYLNSLPSDVKKYVVVNEGGVPVPYPDGIPMPAQTIMFLTRINKPSTNITYLKIDQFNQLLDMHYTMPTAILLMEYDKSLFAKLQFNFPNGQIEINKTEDFAIFKLDF